MLVEILIHYITVHYYVLGVHQNTRAVYVVHCHSTATDHTCRIWLCDWITILVPHVLCRAMSGTLSRIWMILSPEWHIDHWLIVLDVDSLVRGHCCVIHWQVNVCPALQNQCHTCGGDIVVWPIDKSCFCCFLKSMSHLWREHCCVTHWQVMFVLLYKINVTLVEGTLLCDPLTSHVCPALQNQCHTCGGDIVVWPIDKSCLSCFTESVLHLWRGHCCVTHWQVMFVLLYRISVTLVEGTLLCDPLTSNVCPAL